VRDSRKSALKVAPPCTAPPGPPKPQTKLTASRLLRDDYVQGVLSGNRAILGRAITLVESTRASDAELAEQVLEACLPHTGNSIRVGITGVPGAGKSTLIEALGMLLIRKYDKTVAVLAVDPSSQISGGSILGDKTRMAGLAACDKAFIRPSPSRGSLGGVAQRTREAMLLCEAAGYRTVLVETVGVGQSEVAVHDMVDFFLLLMLAGAGDELQGMKRGVMELADLVVINKADVNPAAAARARAEAENALHYFPALPTGWRARAVTSSARSGQGIDELWNCVLEHQRLTLGNGSFRRVRREQSIKWMNDILQQGLANHFWSHPASRTGLVDLEKDIVEGRMTPFRAARTLLQLYTDPNFIS
jgi:LAO/AO transport system kinase